MTANSNVSLLIAVIVGLVGVFLSVRSFHRDEAWLKAQRLSAADDADVRQLLRREIAELQRQIDALKQSDREKDIIIQEQSERIAELTAELELYRTQFTATRKVQSRTSKTTTTTDTTYGQRKLSGEQKAALRVALLDTYPRREDWEALLQDIDHQLDLVAFGNNLETTARRVLEQAEAGGWLVTLMTEAQKQRPQSAALDDLVNTLLHVLEP